MLHCWWTTSPEDHAAQPALSAALPCWLMLPPGLQPLEARGRVCGSDPPRLGTGRRTSCMEATEEQCCSWMGAAGEGRRSTPSSSAGALLVVGEAACSAGGPEDGGRVGFPPSSLAGRLAGWRCTVARSRGVYAGRRPPSLCRFCAAGRAPPCHAAPCHAVRAAPSPPGRLYAPDGKATVGGCNGGRHASAVPNLQRDSVCASDGLRLPMVLGASVCILLQPLAPPWGVCWPTGCAQRASCTPPAPAQHGGRSCSTHAPTVTHPSAAACRPAWWAGGSTRPAPQRSETRQEPCALHRGTAISAHVWTPGKPCWGLQGALQGTAAGAGIHFKAKSGGKLFLTPPIIFCG